MATASFERPYADRDEASTTRNSLRSIRSRLSRVAASPFDDPDGEEAHLSFLDHLLPDPSHHRAQSRAISTGIVILFFAFTLWKLGTGAEAGIPARPQEWLDGGYYVKFGPGPGGASRVVQGTSDSNGVGSSNSNVKASSGFDKASSLFKSKEINLLVGYSALSEYIFHSSVVIPPASRVIIIGDVHGSIVQLRSLLSHIRFRPLNDILFHVGDIVSKSTVQDSLAVVKQFREWKVKGVRGNHDQGVLEWRNWMEAMGPLIAANEKRSIAETKKDYIEVDEEVVVEEDELRDMEVDEIISDTIITSPANSSGKMTAAAGTVPPSSSNRTILDASLSEFAWLSTKRADLESLGIEVPDGWEWGSNWFEIAKALPHEDAEYLRELPLTIRVDELNAFIVHAGLLPWSTPPASTTSSALDLAPIDLSHSISESHFSPTSSVASTLASSSAMSILLVPENTSPFTLLNMRTVKKNQASKEGKNWTVSKKGKGKGEAWHEVWDKAMSVSKGARVNVIYGHWAAQGLKITDHTFGLDSGCAFGRRLSMLVMSNNSSSSPIPPRDDARVRIRAMAEEESETDEDDVDTGPAVADKGEFEQQKIAINGQSAWVVSRSCSDRVVVV